MGEPRRHGVQRRRDDEVHAAPGAAGVVGAQGGEAGRVEGDGAVPGVALDGLGDRGPADGGDLLGDGERAGVEVDVGVAQADGFAAA